MSSPSEVQPLPEPTEAQPPTRAAPPPAAAPTDSTPSPPQGVTTGKSFTPSTVPVAALITAVLVFALTALVWELWRVPKFTALPAVAEAEAKQKEEAAKKEANRKVIVRKGSLGTGGAEGALDALKGVTLSDAEVAKLERESAKKRVMDFFGGVEEKPEKKEKK